MTIPKDDINIHKEVRKRYGQYASDFEPKSGADCGCGCSSTSSAEKVAQMYDAPDVIGLPDDVTGISLGCGDPITLASLQPGQVVLDLGSGGGIDCFLAAQRVGDRGRVIGVDMTPEMLARAQSTAERLGFANTEFRHGYLEALPVEDESIDVVISNCVINLSPDKSQVFSEIFRVLKPGGRLSISDVIAIGELPGHIKNDIQNWNACGAGAIPNDVYEEALREAGFVEVEISPKTYQGPVPDNVPDEAGSLFSSAKITARKP